MNRLFNAIKYGWFVYQKPEMHAISTLRMITSLFELIMKVAAEHRHLMTKIALIIPDEPDKEIVSIWAGAGIDACPTKRIAELIEENQILKMKISDLITGEPNGNNRRNITRY